MNIKKFFSWPILLALCLGFLPASANDKQADVVQQLREAELQLHMGVVMNGASRSFMKAEDLLDTATEELDNAGLPAAEQERLTRELKALRADVDALGELYDDRFFGVFPLARLTVPSMLAEEGLVLAEQMYHPPDVAAVLTATGKLVKQLDRLGHPHVVFRSSPENPYLENIAVDVLLRDGSSTPHTRRGVVDALDEESLEAFDRGDISPGMVNRFLAAFNAVGMLLVNINQPGIVDNGAAVYLRGDLYVPGEIVQGSPVDASDALRVNSFQYFGFALDRRGQRLHMTLLELAMLVIAVLWALQLRWNPDKPLKHFFRASIGLVLFLFGRVFTVAIISVLGNSTPDATEMVQAAWWWPAAIGVLVILGPGLIAWVLQAWLTNIIPRTRGARAVGSIFALTALGASSYFVTPLLLLDESRGLFNLVPFVATGLGLAVVFGLAARTGPPVPHYFMLGPLVLAAALGISLFTASPVYIWSVATATVLLILAGWLRHRLAMKHGTEEPCMTEQEAAKVDQERLARLGKKLKR